VILNLVSSQSMPAYFSDSLTSLRSLVVRNWDVDLEHATDCGQMTGNPSIEISRWDLNFRVTDDNQSSSLGDSEQGGSFQAYG
jgi:hypothetical protein